ncbi:MAG: hypothetical protein JRF33_26755 [Deltaproteobacteria bacterium]|nr:hypothetical protein [Deltaproteobacteria bacterium]
MVKRIQGHGRGYAFSAKDFLDLGKRGAVDVALGRLVVAGKIRHVARGLYDYPQQAKLLGGLLAPDVDQVAQAIARKTGTQIHPSGAWSANMLGLSDQVPAKVVYLTNGRTRSVRLGSQTIYFRHTHPKHLRDDPQTSLAIQAIRFLGKAAIGDKEVRRLRRVLSASDRLQFLKRARYNTGWVADIARKVAEGASDG